MMTIMSRVLVVCMAILMMMTMCLARGGGTIRGATLVSQGPEAVEKWFEELPGAKEKITKLHFYFQDIWSGTNPTSVLVAQPRSGTGFPEEFGSVSVKDDPLTVGPEAESELIGRAQGIASQSSRQGTALLMALNFVFTTGKYNGSTLTILGHNRILNQYRELPILGGTGVFRLARGIATVQTFSFNVTSFDAVLEFDLVVQHY